MRTSFGSRAPLAYHADRLVLFAAINEFRRVMEHQHRSLTNGCEPLLRAEKVPRQNLVLADPAVLKESIGCLRSRPILTGERNAAPYSLRELFQ